MSRAPALVRLLVVAPLALSTGCASLKSAASSSKEVTVAYGVDAKQNYDQGMAELANHNWLEATKYLEFVSTKFPYSSYAALAELALADGMYEQEKWIESAEKYRTFLKLHPTHARIDYAAFRIGMAHYAEVPSNFFLLPSPAEKDQAALQNALATFDEFALQYPDSAHRPEALAKSAEIRGRLADHEVRIAQFYVDHGRPLAALGRYEAVVKRFPGLAEEPEWLLRIGKFAVDAKEPERARPALEQLLAKHPGDSRAAQARALLATLPPLPVAPPTPAAEGDAPVAAPTPGS